MIRTSLASCFLLAGALTAQTSATSIYVPDNKASAGGSNVIPFGTNKRSTTWKNQKYQMLVPASFARKVPVRISDLAFSPGFTRNHNFDSIVIKMAVIKGATLDRTFAKNLATRPVTVLNAKNYTWHLKKDSWNRIGLQTTYLWIPTFGNLVIDIEVRGAGGVGGSSSGFRRSSTIERLYAFGWATKPPAAGQSSKSLAAVKVELVTTDADARPFGQGCSGSNGTPALGFTGTAQLGKTLTVNLTNALASSVALHMIGFNNKAPVFPLDLGPLGAPACLLFMSPDMAFPLPTGTGTAKQLLPIPNTSSLVGGRFWNQYLVLDKKANKFGFAVSNNGRVLIGQ